MKIERIERTAFYSFGIKFGYSDCRNCYIFAIDLFIFSILFKFKKGVKNESNTN